MDEASELDSLSFECLNDFFFGYSTIEFHSSYMLGQIFTVMDDKASPWHNSFRLLLHYELHLITLPYMACLRERTTRVRYDFLIVAQLGFGSFCYSHALDRKRLSDQRFIHFIVVCGKFRFIQLFSNGPKFAIWLLFTQNKRRLSDIRDVGHTYWNGWKNLMRANEK